MSLPSFFVYGVGTRFEWEIPEKLAQPVQIVMSISTKLLARAHGLNPRFESSDGDLDTILDYHDYCSLRDNDMFTSELETLGQVFSDTSYDKNKEPPMRIIRKALGRCMCRKETARAQMQQVAVPTQPTMTEQNPWMNNGGYRGQQWGTQTKGFGSWGGKGLKGKGKTPFAKHGTMKGQGSQGMALNITQFTRDMECYIIEDGNGTASAAMSFILCPYDGLPGGCSRKGGKGGKGCRYNHIKSGNTFVVYKSATNEQKNQQFERWVERKGMRFRRSATRQPGGGNNTGAQSKAQQPSTATGTLPQPFRE